MDGVELRPAARGAQGVVDVTLQLEMRDVQCDPLGCECDLLGRGDGLEIALLGDRYSAPRDVLQVYVDEFDRAYQEGTMFLLTMHPHVSGHRSRIVALEGLIDHMQAKGDVWFATHEDAARYVREQAGMD